MFKPFKTWKPGQNPETWQNLLPQPRKTCTPALGYGFFRVGVWVRPKIPWGYLWQSLALFAIKSSLRLLDQSHKLSRDRHSCYWLWPRLFQQYWPSSSPSLLSCPHVLPCCPMASYCVVFSTCVVIIIGDGGGESWVMTVTCHGF